MAVSKAQIGEIIEEDLADQLMANVCSFDRQLILDHIAEASAVKCYHAVVRFATRAELVGMLEKADAGSTVYALLHLKLRGSLPASRRIWSEA